VIGADSRRRYGLPVPYSGRTSSRSLGVVLAVAVVLLGPSACKRNYRIGEYVLVQWDKDTKYPAYIVEKRGDGRYRVHFDRMDSRWDEDVTIDRIKDVLKEHVDPPPPPQSVRDATERLKPPQASSATPLAPYQAGDHVKVRWHGTKYDATIRSVVAADQFLVHYEGYEDAYDEKVGVDRIVGRR
jgi:hypothetical protein